MNTQPNLSISYAPDSIRYSAPPAPSIAGRQPAWILCRKLDQFPIPDNVVLMHWAHRGRIRPDDYLVNLRLDECFQAKEIAELKLVFLKITIRRLEKIAWLFPMGAFAIVWMSPLFGSLILAAGLAAAIRWFRKNCDEVLGRHNIDKESDGGGVAGNILEALLTAKDGRKPLR